LNWTLIIEWGIDKMTRNLRALLFVVMLIFANLSVTSAQGSYGDLRGTVTDSAGAVVAGAAVVIRNQATNETRNTTTSQNGEYSVSRLNVGTYTITATAQGFASSAVKDVKVSVAFVTE